MKRELAFVLLRWSHAFAHLVVIIDGREEAHGFKYIATPTEVGEARLAEKEMGSQPCLSKRMLRKRLGRWKALAEEEHGWRAS